MAQSWNGQAASPTCLLCTKSLTSGVCVRCPYCPVNTCVRCSHLHQQTHENVDEYSSIHKTSPPMSPYHPQSHGHSAHQAPYFPPPPSYSQYPPHHGQYTPQPTPPANQFYPQYSPQQSSYFPPPPNAIPNAPARGYHSASAGAGASPSSPFPAGTAPQAGHRNWITAVVDGGVTVAKHKNTKKILKKSIKYGAIVTGLAVGADLTGVMDFDFGDSLGGDVGGGSTMPTDNLTGVGSGAGVAAASGIPFDWSTRQSASSMSAI